MKNDTLGVAVIGTGFIGTVHARSARLAGGRLVAVGASTPERSRAAATALGADRPLLSPDEFASAADIDVVHVCTPNAVHAQHTRAALEAGKHVICEKPLAVDLGEAVELAELARRKRLTTAVPFVYRFYPIVREARTRVAAGLTGPLRLLHGSYLQDWLSRADDWSWRVDPSEGGASRALADIGSHWCDLVEFVSGHRITRLVARLHTAIPERVSARHREAFQTANAGGERRAVTTEDVGLVLFETDRGAVGSVVASQISPGRKNRLWFELDGAEAALAFDQERPDGLWIGERTGNRLVVRDAEQLSAEAGRLSVLPPGHPQGYHDCFDLFVADTYRTIRGDELDGLPTFDDGVRAVRIVDCALESVRTGAWTEVAT